MEIPPSLRPWLERIGINTTQLQWRLYQWEKRRSNAASQGSRLPVSLQWLNYPHKFCLKCSAINNREDKRCASCGARLPSVLGYRIFRMLGIVFPESANPVTFSFLGVIMAFFLLGVVRDGFIGAFNPPRDTLAIFGMYQPAQVLRTWEFWRLMSFGLLHAGIIHLFFNGFAVSQVGPIIESHIGRSRMLVLITLGQLGAAVATHLWYFEFRHSNVPTVGASGWLFALIGYGIGGAQHFGVRGFVMRSFFLQWAMYGFLFGLFMGANNAAHFGGFAAGYLLGFVPIRQIPGRFTWNRVWMTAAGISGVIWVLTLGFMALSIGTQWNVRQ